MISQPFQFQFGTIKSYKHAGTTLQINKFQFQFGTIKRYDCNKREITFKIFQFKFGTIKRGRFGTSMKFKVNLNSRLVRLRVLKKYLVWMGIIYFNFIMV